LIHYVTSVSATYHELAYIAAGIAHNLRASCPHDPTPRVVHLKEVPHLREAEQGDLLIELHREILGRHVVCPSSKELPLLRLLRRVREGALEAPDLAVHVNYRKKFTSRLRVDASGEFIDIWPEGFFDARVAELF
jgi:hypothetical protein